MPDSPINVTSPPKPRKTPPHLRKPQIIALQNAGLTQTEIGKKLGVSRATIVADLQELRPAKKLADELLSSINDEYEKLQTPADIAGIYVNLATKAKNEAVSLAAQDRILEHRGVITAKEAARAKAAPVQQNTAMFILSPGTQIDFGGMPTRDTKVIDVSAGDVSSRDTQATGVPPRDDQPQ